MELTVLGCSGSFGGAGGAACSGYLLQSNGTSIWMDPTNDVFVILLSNRVNPTRANTKIGRVRVQLADAHRWARGYAPEGDDPLIVFLDPPYREYENHPERVRRTLEILLERLPEGSTLAVESRRDLDDAVLPDPIAWDVRRYGGTQIGIRTVERTMSGEAGVDDEPE